jgi:aminoglycoside phosphotransferase (APT) family kinase protein
MTTTHPHRHTPDPLAVLRAGRSHTTYLARGLRTGRLAVIKTGGDTAKLAREAKALAALAATPSPPCTRLLDIPAISTPGPPSQPHLILAYIPGRHPRTLADYQSFGAALATLHNTAPSAALRTLAQPPSQLLHPARTLAAATAPDLTALIDTLTPAPGQPWTVPVPIHGDATPANALIHHRHSDAVLIDFENATLANPGLDIGRAIFLTAMAPAPARQRHARIDAILTGYTRHRTLPAHITHWAAAAGLQIAAWRYIRRTQHHIPPWTIALDHARRWADSSQYPHWPLASHHER